MAHDNLAYAIAREPASRETIAADTLAEALIRVARGDRDAFEDVYRRTAAKLFGVCLRMLPGQAEAEDVIQDVYCAVWRHAGMFDPRRGTAMTWLITITRNRAVDRLRRSRRAIVVPIEAASAMPDPRPSAFDTIAVHDDHHHMRRWLDVLGARDADALKAAFFGGSTYTDLARSAGIPLGTMKSRMRRALLRLRDHMAEAG